MDRKALPLIGSFAALYFLMLAALGAEIPFVPQVLAGGGLTASHIGLVLASGTIAQVFAAPVFGRIADRLGARPVLFAAALGAAGSLLLLLVASGRLGGAMIVYVLFAIATAPLNPLADAITVPACARIGVPYGRIRGVGSGGFFVGIVLSSAVAARLGITSITVTSAILFVAMTATLPFLRSAAPVPRMGSTAGDIGALLRIVAFRRVLLVAALIIGSHAMSDAFAVIHWHSIGIPAETIGVMLAAAVVSECLVFVFIGPLLLRKLGPSTCAAIGGIVGAARWSILAESPNVWLVLATQLLHGLTFSLVHLACMEVLASVVPPRVFATAQSLYSVCSNAIASAAITLAAGALFGTLHGHAFWLAAALCASACPVALRLRASLVATRIGSSSPATKKSAPFADADKCCDS